MTLKTVIAAWPIWVPILTVVIASLVTRLTPYPRAGGVVTALRVVLDVLSVLTHKDSPGVVQLPLLQRSQPPGAPPDASPPPAALLLLVVLLALPRAALADSAALRTDASSRPVILIAPEVPAPSPPQAVLLTDAQKAAVVAAAVNAAAKDAQAGIQAAPILKSWAETRAGQIVMGCIAGAIIVTSAGGAAAGVLATVR